MINYQHSFSFGEIEHLNGILSNITIVIINVIANSTISFGIEYAIKYIQNKAFKLLTTITFLHTVYRMKLFSFYNF